MSIEDCDGDELAEPTDGRADGDWKSRYPAKAWLQIFAELLYLMLLLVFSVVFLLVIGNSIASAPAPKGLVTLQVIDLQIDRGMLRWVAVAISGMIGGITFDLKWLYHSVAKRLWNQDRCLWRLLVPFISGVVSVFLIFLLKSETLPFLKGKSFDNFYAGMGFGFLFGYFSDSVLAKLKRFSDGVFGRTDSGGD